MVNREHSLATQHSFHEVSNFWVLDANAIEMDETNENEKSKRNIENRKQTQQPNVRIDRFTFQSEVLLYLVQRSIKNDY